MNEYIEEAQSLVRNLDQRMSTSIYDVSWLARLRETICWPDLLGYLLQTQHSDGSWGGAIEHYHDRVLCTLAAIVALRENNGYTPEIGRAERYLWSRYHLLPQDAFELSGFELIFPTLLEEARTLDLSVPIHACGYGEIQTAKLRLLPIDLLYSRHISSVYSLEFLGRTADAAKLGEALSSNGALGNSPATTAYYLLVRGEEDPQALAYLREVYELNRIVTVYPFRTFELSWVLNNLLFSGLPLNTFATEQDLETLSGALSDTGAALDETFGVTDGDITSVCCHVLAAGGWDVSPSVLSHFENPDTHIFRTYAYERNMSTSTNIHAMDALRRMKYYPDAQAVREQVALRLLDNRIHGLYWVDKWHASPFYATAHALVGLLKESSKIFGPVCQHTVDWLLHTQYSDGSWGFFKQGTLEETAYVLTALLTYRQHVGGGEMVKFEALQRAANFIKEHYNGDNNSFPELWLAKSCYAPYDIVRSAILAALILYEQVAQ